MARVQSTSYIVSAISVAWSSGQTLDSLTDNEYTDLSDEIDNSTNKYVLADFEVVLASAAFNGSDSAIELRIVRSQDGTNYPDYTGNTTTDQQHNSNFPAYSKSTTGGTAAQRLVFEDVVIPPGKFKVSLRNRANVTLAASGNTVTYRPHSVEMSA